MASSENVTGLTPIAEDNEGRSSYSFLNDGASSFTLRINSSTSSSSSLRMVRLGSPEKILSYFISYSSMNIAVSSFA